MLVTEEGIEIVVKLEAPLKALSPIYPRELPKIIDFRLFAFLNISDSIRMTELGSVKLA